MNRFAPSHRKLFPLLALPLLAAAAPLSAQDGGNGAAGVYSTDQAQRGENAFETNCSYCHSAGQFSGDTFMKTWGKGTLAELFDFVSNQMPQDNPGGLRSQEYADILAWFLRRNGVPAGSRELPPDPAVLKTIRIAPPGGALPVADAVAVTPPGSRSAPGGARPPS